MVKEFIDTINLDNLDNVIEEYLELLIARVTYSSMSLEVDLGNPSDAKNAIRFRDNMRAFKFLLANLKNNIELSQEIIVKVADIINSSSFYISDGYRKIDGKYIAETDIPISLVENISNDMKKLLEDYKKWSSNLEMDIFVREALFHLKFIHIHPFEDGNGRTARLLLNFNLIKDSVAPIVITDDLLEYYHDYIRNNDVLGLADLFAIQSKKEQYVIDEIVKERVSAEEKNESLKKR